MTHLEVVVSSAKHILATFIESSGFPSLSAPVHFFFYKFLENEMVLYYERTTE